MTNDKVQAQSAREPRRRPLSGGYARGAEQRARIIKAALKVFGEEGYERASTRMIAREAGIQPPALQYHFDSKEGLHRSCGEHLADLVMELLSEPLRAATAAADGATPEGALDALCALMDALVDASLFSGEAPERARFSARAQSEDGPATQIIRERVSGPILDAAARLVAIVLGRPVDETVRLRTQLLMGQLAALHVHQKMTLAKVGWPDFDGPRRAALKAVLRTHTRGSLGFGPRQTDRSPPS